MEIETSNIDNIFKLREKAKDLSGRSKSRTKTNGHRTQASSGRTLSFVIPIWHRQFQQYQIFIG